MTSCIFEAPVFTKALQVFRIICYAFKNISTFCYFYGLNFSNWNFYVQLTQMNIPFWTSTVKSLLVTSCSDSIYNILQHYPPLDLTGECYFVQHFCWRREYGVSQNSRLKYWKLWLSVTLWMVRGSILMLPLVSRMCERTNSCISFFFLASTIWNLPYAVAEHIPNHFKLLIDFLLLPAGYNRIV